MVGHTSSDFPFKIIHRSVKSNLLHIVRLVLQPEIPGGKGRNVLSLNPNMLLCSYDFSLPGSFRCQLLPVAISAPIAAGNGKNRILRSQIHIIRTVIRISYIDISSVRNIIAGHITDRCISKKCRTESGGNTHHINNTCKYQRKNQHTPPIIDLQIPVFQKQIQPRPQQNQIYGCHCHI